LQGRAKNPIERRPKAAVREDILGSPNRAVIVGELATRIKSSGKIINTQFAIILTISGDKITCFQMLEDSFDLSRTVRG